MNLNVLIVGAGPAGLCLACRLKRLSGRYAIRIVEQKPIDATFGFGLAFSQRALESLRSKDEDTWATIWPSLEFWDDSVICLNGQTVRIDGMGYAGIGRLTLLRILRQQAERLGIAVEYGRTIRAEAELAGADLVVGADGANSVVRGFTQHQFGTTATPFNNRFAWYGTRRLFDALTHTFLDTEYGAFNAHHHRHASDMSTFVVEVDEATWFRCGFDAMAKEDAQRFCESLFADSLGGEKLISNKSIWRRFSRVSNRCWWSGNRVLLGDALHTAHFSIGSGTRIAIEDALELAAALERHKDAIPEGLSAFELARRPRADPLIDAANASANWYENFARHMRLPPMEFAMSYITRSGRVDAAKLRRTSAAFMQQYERYRVDHGLDRHD